MRFLLTTCFLLLIANSVFTQPNTGLEVWADYYHYHKLSGKWQLYNDAGFRFESLNTDDEGWWRIHVRPSFAFRPRARFDLRGGLALMYNHYNNASSPSYLEFRPWQGAKVYWPTIGKMRFTHYFRLEERGVYDDSGNGTDFFLKGRYQISTQIPLNNTSVTVGTYFIPISVEFFMDLNKDESDTRNDRFRFTTGLGFRKSKKTDVLLRYIIQKSPTGENFDSVIRFSVKQHFGF